MRFTVLSVLTTTMFASSLASAETVIEYSDEPMRRSSWNLIAGGVAGRGDLLQGEVGFSMLAASYHHSLSNRMTIGGLVGIDYGLWAPGDPYLGTAVVLGMPLRISIVEEARYGFTMRAVPGLYLGFDQPGRFSDEFIPGVWLDFGVSGGYRFDHGFVFGGGLDLPMLIGFPTEYRDTFFAIPILIGPMAEWHFAEDLAVTADFKFGPHLVTDDYYDTDFGFRFMLGLAYHL
jgi:hypothetical protein